MNILFAASEIYPLMKTGGLADVAYALPLAIAGQGQDIRLLMPAYRDALARLQNVEVAATLELGGHKIRLLQSRLPSTDLAIYLLDYPPYFDRAGNPYTDSLAKGWPDNAERFALFCRTIQALALNQASLDWPVDIVHLNDWHTGLAAALLESHVHRPATLFTLHNLAYQGIFPETTFQSLALPQRLWGMNGLEFHQQLSFIKGGLVFADAITTVSPRYAQEIQTAEFGEGLDGLLRSRADRLSGILNGIDTHEWDPANDNQIASNYDATRLRAKTANKTALRKIFNLQSHANCALLGILGRLSEQKGIELLLEALPRLLELPIQLVILGSGEPLYETQLQNWAQRYPQRLGLHLGFDARLAHQLIAGCDIFLMPSRFEPCGLTQLYAMRYGTIPLVRRTGGLHDTVVNYTAKRLNNGNATGFGFGAYSVAALAKSLGAALGVFADARQWRVLQQNAMRQDFSWDASAAQYLKLYRKLLDSKQRA